MEKRKPVWHSPYVVETASIGQYLLKAVAKIAVGTYVASPMLAGDGWHNVADIFQAAVVVMGIWLARRKLKEYPYGLRNIESILAMAIGVMLLGTALRFASQSVLGLLAQMPTLDAAARDALTYLPKHEPLRIEWRLFPWLVGLTTTSALFSLITSWFQIKAGTVSGEGSLVADGKETRADSWIEFAALGGVLIEYLLGWRMIEYIIGCVVAGLVTHTAWEILKPGFDQLVQRSLGLGIENGIKTKVLSVCGVEDVVNLKTFRIGRSLAIVHFRIISRLPAPAHDIVRKMLKTVLGRYLTEACDGIKKSEVYISFKQPDANPHRVAYAVKLVGPNAYRIASTCGTADHILVCDIFDDEAVKVEPHLIPQDMLAWLVTKRVSEIRMLDPDKDTIGSNQTDVRLASAISPLLETHDLID